MAKLSFFTLLLAFTLAQYSLVTIPGVNALEPANSGPLARRYDHIDMKKRMIRKRQEDDVPRNPAPAPESGTSTDTDVATSQTTPNRSNTVVTPTGQSTSPTTTGQTQTTPTSVTSTSTTATSTSTTPTSTSTTPPPVTSDDPRTSPSSTRSNTRSTGTITRTTVTTPTETEDNSKDQSASFLSRSAIIGLIVAGSCVVAGAAIWTIIRKWKFSPSRHFEDRLEPINWEPTQSSGLPHDPTVAALARGNSQNGRRPSMESSVNGGRNMSNLDHPPVTMTPDFPPAHDFTAGPSLAPGYVDMHRGPSPGPGPYGGAHYDTPNPYDAYDYNAGYGQRRY